MFNAIWLEKVEGTTQASVRKLDDSVLGTEGVSVDVHWSSLNYKDALAITGRSPVVRSFPMIPGIDFAGIVTASENSSYSIGQRVLLNGWGHGEFLFGGFSEKARVAAEHLIPLPSTMTTRGAMSIGTAGYTAALCIQALEASGLTPGRGDVLVTGANGGVGGFAIALLAKRGYRVVAATGRVAASDRLIALGAAEVIPRERLSGPGKPLQQELWAGVIDTAGSHILANACAQTCYGGVVAACGLAQGLDFTTTVAPFILRGVRLLGIDSVMAPKEVRVAAWNRLATDLESSVLDAMTTEIALDGVIAAAPDLLAGEIQGRLVIRIR